MNEPEWAPLTGFRVAVTSARRADELGALLRKRGASVTSAAAIEMVPLPDDRELRVHTEALIDAPPDIVIATTGIGFRGWVAAADGWGLANDLITSLGKARIVSRGPKATGALRAAGLPEEWSPESESSRELLHYLVEGGISGQRVAVQLHGATAEWDPFPEFLDELRAAGADVVPIRVYRWHPVPRNGDFDQLVAGIAEEKFDAVSFTSAPAVAAVLMRAGEMGIEDRVLTALRDQCARDVRRTGHRAPPGPARCAHVGTGADAAGRAGPPHHRRAAAAAGAHHACGRTPAGDPRHLRPGRRCGEGAVPCGDGDDPRARAPSRHRRVQDRSAARSSRHGHRHARGGDRRAAAANSVGRQEHCLDGGQAWLSVARRRTDWRRRNESIAGRPRHTQAGRRRDDRPTWPSGCPSCSTDRCTSRSSTSRSDARQKCSSALPADRPVTVVPAFLASGYHVRVDLPAHVAASGHPAVTVTAPLGPCPHTVQVMAQRLVECGWRPGDSVVLAAAGTSDAHAQSDLRYTAALLSAVIGDRVEPAYAATGSRASHDAVSRVATHGARDASWWRHTCWRTGCFKIGCATAAPIWSPIR